MTFSGGSDGNGSDRFGRYVIVRRVGAGGMGDVYEGRHVDLNKRVAIKTLRRDRAGDPDARARFLREGQAAAKVRHPNVVEVSDVGSVEGVPYLVMEFLDGEDLAAWLARERGASLSSRVDVMLPVMAAVAAAHDESVLHRDLKPSNIFLSRTRDGELVPKVVDFGISWFASEQPSGLATHEHAIVGTPAYMSPEQTRGVRELTAASDQYALGVIVYECVTGRLPVEPGPVLGMLLRIGRGEFAPPRAVRPELPAELERVVLRAMALDPTQRFATVRELGRALLPFAGERARLLWRNAFEPRSDAATVGGGVGATLAAEGPTTLGSSVHVRAVSTSRGGHRERLAAIGLAAVVVGAVGAWAVLAPSGRGARARGSYEVRVEADPSTAALTLDGAPAGVGVMQRRFVADGAQHVLRVSAPGYASREVVFVDAPPASARVVLPSVAPSVVSAPSVVGVPSVAVTPSVAAPVAMQGVTERDRDEARRRPRPRVPRAGGAVRPAPGVLVAPGVPAGTNGIHNL